MLFQSQPVNQILTLVARGRGLSADLRIAVCGTHRSGTTLVGNLLAADRRTIQIVEPFSPAFGIDTVDRWFVFADSCGSKFRSTIDGFLAAKQVHFRASASRRERLAHWIKPPRMQRAFAAARLVHPDRLIIKDPFLALAGQYLIDHHKFRIVYTVKHPGAFYASLLRVGWIHLPLEDLVMQGALDAGVAAGATSMAARAAVFWNTINGHALAVKRKSPGSVSIWCHDAFCYAPLDETARVARELGIEFSQAMRRAVIRASSGDIVTPPAGTIHALVRNSRALSNAWREVVPADAECELRRRCEPVYQQLFGRAW